MSYCDGCVRKFYRDGDGGLTRDDVERICPKCRGVCNCRACLRRDPGPPPTVSDKLSESTTRQLYEHFLRRAAAPMLASDAAERKEIDAEIECGVNNGAVAPGYYGYSDASHASGWRLFCDACGSAVANLHRSCWACEVDVCGDCCADLRRGNTVGKPAATLASALIMGGSGGVGGDGPLPSEIVRGRVYGCIFDDLVGLKQRGLCFATLREHPQYGAAARRAAP